MATDKTNGLAKGLFLFTLLKRIGISSISKSLILSLAFTSWVGLKSQAEGNSNIARIKVETILPDSFLAVVEEEPDSGAVLYNFWATWCGPCVEELPYFKALDSVYGDKIEIVFLSFDMSDDTQRVERFVLKKGMKGKQYLLDATDLDSFINAIHPNWEGNIPYTIFIKNGRRKDFDHSFSNKKELLEFIEEI